MGEAYFNLKRKLEELGYNNVLPLDAVPLVECILADLLQTTRSLQHYMDLSKEALMQRDSLLLEAEPYKCDNAKLIHENNSVHRENMQLKEENQKLTKELRRKIKALSEELIQKDATIGKLQHDVRDLSLRGLCAETLSTRNKSKRKDEINAPRICNCNKLSCGDKVSEDLTKQIILLEEKICEYRDEIMLLKNQVEHRDNEIIRLNMLLEGGRPIAAINKDCCHPNTDGRLQNIMKELREMEITNDTLKKEIDTSLEKQHEAMLRALSLADKNKTLQEEIQKVDALALKVEEDCNKRLAAMMNDVNFMQTRIEGLLMKNSELERQLNESSKQSSPHLTMLNESLIATKKENDALQKEIKDLVDLNKSLQEKLALCTTRNTYKISKEYEVTKDRQKCPTKDELQLLLEKERMKYEKHITDIQQKLSETIDMFNKHMQICKDSKKYGSYGSYSNENAFVRDLHNKLCESEQRILMVKKENDELKSQIFNQQENNKQNYKDIISQLNVENAELSKENIALSQQLSHYRNMNSAKYNERGDYSRREVERLKDTINSLTHEVQLLKKDKNEYNLRYKEAMEIADKLKRDLVQKQKAMENLEEENCSYKMTHRTGKASADRLKEECNYLKEQIKKMQSDMIKEKTLASQIKNIQIETERSSNEIQNELLCMQKKLSVSKDTIDSLERKVKELHSEVASLRNDKSNLIDNIRQVDQERDKLVIELDHKTENISVLEQKINSQNYDINKLESEIADLKRKLTVSKVSEHKLVDNEAQISFLNNEILRLKQQLDSATIENKHLQNSLADANGNLKVIRIEYEKSRKDVDGLKEQLQHYVAEIRRIEEMLSHKEAERSDMLEQFASLSVEANILENTNHSLESESASKSMQLQTYISKIEDLESKLLDKDTIIENHSARIAQMTCKITSLENEIKLITEEKTILEQNVAHLKQMCNNLQSENTNSTKGIGNVDSELKLYENRIKSLSRSKANLEVEKEEIKENLLTTERLLANARKEIVDLKLALQDATSETKSLHDRLSSRRETEIHETTMTQEQYDLPLMLEEIHEVSHEEDEDSSRYHSTHKTLSKYSHHHSTL